METGSVHKDENGSRGEIALNTEAYFHGTCRKCGKWGHKANICKSGQKSGRKKKFEGTCNWCGKKGHKEKQWFSKKNGKPRTVTTENSENTEEEVLACMCVVVHEGQEDSQDRN